MRSAAPRFAEEADVMVASPKTAKVTTEWKYPRPFLSCRFDPTERFVFAGAEDNSVSRWSVADGSHVVLQSHDSWVHCLAFDAGGQQLISGGCDGRLKWWPVADAAPAEIRSLDAHQGWIRSVATSPDGKLLASGGNDHLVRLWDSSSGELLATLEGHESHVYSVAFDPQQRFLYSGELRGQVRQWELPAARSVATFDLTALHSYNKGQGVDYGGVRTIAVSADGRQIACGGLHKATNPLGAVNDPLLIRFDLESAKAVKSHVAEGLRGVIWRAMYDPQGTLTAVAGGSSGGFLLFWNDKDEKETFRFKLPNVARDMDRSRDGLRIVTAHSDNQLRITTLATA
jgi:WD40 repeat protein